MLTPLIPLGGRRRENAYRVPWRVERLHESHTLVTNTGPDPADLVRVFVHSDAHRGERGGPPGRARSGTGDHRSETHHWGLMTPGESAELCLCALDPESCVVTLAWFRPDDGREYVWRYAP